MRLPALKQKAVRLRKEENPCPSLTRASAPASSAYRQSPLGWLLRASCRLWKRPEAEPVFCPESQALPRLGRNRSPLMPQFTPSCQWGPLPASVAHEPFPAELEKELSRRPRKVCIVKVVGTRNLWKNIVVLCVNS